MDSGRIFGQNVAGVADPAQLPDLLALFDVGRSGLSLFEAEIRQQKVIPAEEF